MRTIVASFFAGFMLLSCSSVPPCPVDADDYVQHLQGRSAEPFWFKNAVIQTSYHTASIAPYEVVEHSDVPYFADRLTMTERMCSGERTTLKMLRQSRFLKVVAHGHFDDRGTTLILDCICSAEPVVGTPELEKRMEPMISR